MLRLVIALALAVSQSPSSLRIVVVEGENAVNIIQQKTAVHALVEVRDQNNLPVSGASVTFVVASKGSAAAAAHTVTVVTNATGQAALGGVTPAATGGLQISVSATFSGVTATTTISQTVVATAAAAAGGAGAAAGAAGGAGAAAAGGAGAAAAGGAAAGGAAAAGGISAGAVAGIVGGTAAAVGGGVAAANSGGGDNNGGTSSSNPSNPSNPGSPTTGGTTPGTPTPGTPPASGCVFSVASPVSLSAVPSTADTYTFTVTGSGATCSQVSWSASSASPFVTVSPLSGVGNGTVAVAFAANALGSPSRTFQFTIAGNSFSGTQNEGNPPCNLQQVAGGNTPETRTIELGRTSGTFNFTYNTLVVPDRMVVTYGGNTLFDTGCVGTDGNRTQSIFFSGSTTTVTIAVTPNCSGPDTTEWSFTVSCPQ